MPSSFFDATDDLPTMTYSPDMAKLLSAASYPQAPSNASSDNRSDEQLFGGIVPATESGDEDGNDLRPKKRSRASKVDDFKNGGTTHEGTKRQRGRPKVSTKDETAAERRRTQIRLAQRAYRNRKENTITELTEKVENLQSIIKTLNTGFARLRETLLNTGMVHSDSALARQVDDLTQRLSEASEPMLSDAEKTSEGEDSEPHSQILTSDRSTFGVTDGHVAPLALQGQTNPATTLGPVADVHSNLLGIGADRNMFDLEGQSLTDFQSYPALPTNYPTSSVFKAVRPQFLNLQTSPSDTPALMSIDRFPNKRFYTYSFQETTFARRLHRLCIERAFQRLMSSHVDPNWLLKTFQFTFNFSNKDRIVKTFKNILARGTDEPLENWRTPFIHIGGAGLHFPRLDVHGQPIYPPNLLDPGHAAAPWRIPDTETIPSANTLEEILESIGFGGEWFDCHDVEGYLKTKGIYPQAQESFVVVDSALVGLSSPAGSETTGTISSGSSPQSLESAQFSQRRSTLSLETVTTSNQSSGPTKWTSTLNEMTDDWLGQQETYGADDFDLELPPSTFEIAARETRLLTIEIEKFLERLSDESVCLGRAPGFRREHVDNALFLAMQEAF